MEISNRLHKESGQSGMSETSYPREAWVRLGREVRRRRIELDMNQPDVSAAGGPSTGVISKIENAKQDFYEDRVMALLERALRWRPGSAQKILDGGNPSPVREPGELPPFTAEVQGAVTPPGEAEGPSHATPALEHLLAALTQELADLKGVKQDLVDLQGAVKAQSEKIEELTDKLSASPDNGDDHRMTA